ncbi:hypothetical protein EP073_08375 [Geovibrio thiophilus]|uniref:Uncharacterized protein n=1 Tax=Geovibrio thiophilus TaxID=139438 RepID=A0A3R5Y793_9BACT|nr:hypothetical protein [Geovibrio thiophilus]QAR33414.1 hypothetical protein EP073_08375 [Geovibrio thiophilus]
MKLINYLALILMFVFITFTGSFAAPIKIGTTVLEGKTTKGDEIRVEVTTVNNPKESPYSTENAWGTHKGSVKPRIIISSMKIIMNDEQQYIPMSTYMDLTEPKEIKLNIQDEQTIRIIIQGGIHEEDTGYIAEILYLGDILVSKSVRHTRFPNNIREDTMYKSMY